MCAKYFLFLLQNKLSISTVTPACGATIKQNLSYYIQQPTQNPPQSNCAYTICPISSNVNRIRLDFTVITIDIFFMEYDFKNLIEIELSVLKTGIITHLH